MNTLTRTTRRMAALLDPTAPAKRRSTQADLPHEFAAMPIASFYDDGFAVFIGDDAVVRVPVMMTVEPERLRDALEHGGIAARAGRFPVEFGIVVEPFVPGYVHPAACMGSRNAAYTAWRLAQDLLMPMLLGADA